MKEARILRRHRTVDEARGKGVCEQRGLWGGCETPTGWAGEVMVGSGGHEDTTLRPWLGGSSKRGEGHSEGTRE